MAKMKHLASVWPTILRDGAGILGAGLIVAGVGQIYMPAGFIVAGAMLIAGAVLSVRAAG